MVDRITYKINKINKLLIIIFSKMVSHPNSINILNYVIGEFRTRFLSRGLGDTLAYFKESRLCVTRYLSGEPLTSSDLVSLTKTGWPRWLSAVVDKDMISSDPLLIKALLTCLTIGRSFNLAAKLDTESITQPTKADVSQISELELKWACKRLGVRPVDHRFKDFHLSTKSGPNGQAILSSLYESTLIPNSLKESLVKLGGEKLAYKLDGIAKSQEELQLVDWFYSEWPMNRKRGRIRSLSYFPDKEGKTRVIAILDYWSQTCLRPLHNKVNAILKRVKSDCTFNQNHFLSLLPTGPYHSLDLKSATDRMPIALQKRIVTYLLGTKSKSEAWADILVGYGYCAGDQAYVYAAGQPMGAYTSWPVMALTHHAIVQIAAQRANLFDFWDYALLGDDVVIANTSVAEEYRKLLSVLDMPISEAKTHTSPNLYEFAKRWVYNGKEVTGFSTSGLIETIGSYSLFHNFLETQLLHGWEILEGESPGTILEALMKSIGKVQQSTRTSKLLQAHILLQNVIKNNWTAEEGVSQLWDLFALPDTKIPKPELITLVLKNRCIEQGVQDKIRILKEKLNYLTKMSRILKKLGLGAPRTEGIRLALINYTPISGAFTAQLVAVNNDLEVFKSGTEQEQIEKYLERSLRGKSWSEGVFTMRASHSRILNRARMVKDVLNILKTAPDEITELKFPDSSNDIGKVEKITARLMVARDRIRSGGAKPGENTYSTWVIPEENITPYLMMAKGKRNLGPTDCA